VTITLQNRTSPLAQTFRQLGPDAIAAIDQALANGQTRPIKTARVAWNSVRDNFAGILDLFDRSGVENPTVQIRNIVDNPQLTTMGKNQKIDVVMEALGIQVFDLSNEVQTTLDGIEATLRDASIPPKPMDADPTAVADAKSDVKMSLDPLGEADAQRRAVDLLRNALEQQDAVTAWLVCSPWLAQYFTARFPDGDMVGMQERLGQVLDARGDWAYSAPRQALAAVTARYAGNALRQALSLLPRILTAVRSTATF